MVQDHRQYCKRSADKDHNICYYTTGHVAPFKQKVDVSIAEELPSPRVQT